jgi:hypothetical protein
MCDKHPGKPLKRQVLPFAALAKHLERQVRGATERGTVHRYRMAMKNGEEFPPLLVADIGGALVLLDGFHRRAAYEALGIDETEMEILECSSLAEAEWVAFAANMRHGKRLKATAFRPAFRAYIRSNQHLTPDGQLRSYREIARALVEVSYSTVRRWMENDFPEIFAEMAGGTDTADGGLRPAAMGHEEAERALTSQAIQSIADAHALMEGVTSKQLRRRVRDRSAQLATWLDITRGGL